LFTTFSVTVTNSNPRLGPFLSCRCLAYIGQKYDALAIKLAVMDVLVTDTSGPFSRQARCGSQLQARSCKAALAHIRAVFAVGHCVMPMGSPVLLRQAEMLWLGLHPPVEHNPG